MERTIRVKGTGRIRQKPDQTVVGMTLKTVDKDYNRALAQEAAAYSRLCGALRGVGFDAEDVKTTAFDIDAEYESHQDPKTGRHIRTFIGYACEHNLELRFDFDTALLSRVLDVIAKNNTGDPELSIRFAVRDRERAADALLKDAAQNALRKAKVLAEASGVTLGRLLNVDYSWNEVDFYSHTSYSMGRNYLGAPPDMGCAEMEITPDDVHLSDSATFVWEIF